MPIWEDVEDSDNTSCRTQRMRIPGGWLVRTRYAVSADSAAVHTVIVPDSNHMWEIGGDNPHRDTTGWTGPSDR
jgi:hypothetical protein